MGRKRIVPILDPLGLGPDHDQEDTSPVRKKQKLTKFDDSSDEEMDQENEQEQLPEQEQIKTEILPGWMKNGQVLENWKEVPLETLRVWLKHGMEDRLIQTLPQTPEKESLTLFPVQAAVLPGVIRGVQQIQDLCPIYNGFFNFL